MTRTVYHFTFKKKACMRAVEDALVLASLAAAAVADSGRATYRFDERRRSCVIDGRTAAGAALLRVFFAYLVGMFGVRAFRVVTAEDLEGSRRRARPARRCPACRAARRA